jgi:hypothetical protein
MIDGHDGLPPVFARGDGKIAAVQWLHADTESEALGIARETVKGTAKVSGFEVCEGAWCNQKC